MRHLLEPDRPGYVPSVSFLRPDSSEERGSLEIGKFDSVAWHRGRIWGMNGAWFLNVCGSRNGHRGTVGPGNWGNVLQSRGLRNVWNS